MAARRFPPPWSIEDHADDPVVEELTSLTSSLSEDEQTDLVALAWLGRDDYSAGDWPAVRDEAMGIKVEVRTGAIKLTFFGHARWD
jgi:hypothetical protein